MIAEFLSRDVVLDQLREVIDDLDTQIDQARRHAAPVDDADARLLTELRATEARERDDSSGQPGYEGPAAERRNQEPAPLDDFAFISRDPIVGLLQSALDEHSAVVHANSDLAESPPLDDERRDVADDVVVSDQRLREAPAPRRTNDGRRLFDKFSITDIRWVRSKIAEGIRLFRGKREFNPVPAAPVMLPDRARLLIVGDWATGLPRARKVADQMRKMISEGLRNGLAQHVIHLGDTYYSGWGHEYRRRFLPYWPVTLEESDRVFSWTLNGNHDMFAGGYGYFDVLLADPRFARQTQSSFFSLIHPKWKILGLDTAWVDAGLCDPQPSWLLDELSDRSRNHLLFSHHQLFSVYERVTGTLPDTMNEILARHPVRAWLWGHEHRCVCYRPHAGVEFARCVGHGGVPVYMWHKEQDAYETPATYEYRAFIQKGLERWALFGFVVLDFFADGSVRVGYVDENGFEHKSESLV